MSFFSSTKSGSTKPAYTSLQIQTSVNTLPIPVLWGTSKLAPNLIWYGDFTATSEESSGGGKGGGSSTKSYDYTASLVMALCEGPVSGVSRVWADQAVYQGLGPLGLTLFAGGAGQTPWGYLTARHPGEALAYPATAYLAKAGYDLGTSPDLPNHNFEITGALAGEAQDADIALVIQDFLTNAQYGVPGFPAASIDTATLLSGPNAATTGDAAYQTYCRALGLAVSPCLTDQETAQSILARWLDLTNTAAVWSGRTLKFLPYGDLPVTANGVTFVPGLTPVYDLTDDDFIGDGSEDPVLVTRTDPADAYNVVRLEILDRANDYRALPIEARDQNAIEAYGMRVSPTVSAHEICDPVQAGPIAAQLILQRGLYVHNSYQFRLGWEFCLLEPMDVVTLTDPGLGLARMPVRITTIEEDAEGTLTVTAEELPDAVATAETYVKQDVSVTPLNRAVAAAPVNPPILYEPTAALVTSPRIMLAASGGTGGVADPNWGGCQIWVSPDDLSYRHIGDIEAPARQGVLTAALPAPSGSGPDTVNTLTVDLSQSGGALGTGTEADAAAARTLCYVDGELLAYATATLTGPNRYALTWLERGLYGTTASAHAAGTQFARLDAAVFDYDLPPGLTGQTLSVKLVSFNIWGQGLEDISTVTPVTYTVQGAALDFSTSPFMSILYGGGSISLGDLGQPVAGTFACGDLGQPPVRTMRLGQL